MIIQELTQTQARAGQLDTIIDMFHKAMPGYLKILRAKHHGTEFDTEEFIADFIAPMEAKIKAIREQQAKIATHNPTEK